MLRIDLTKKEIGRLVNGYYTEATLHKLMKIDYSDCQRWEENQIFRQFLTKVVGTTPGHWKAPKAIQSWAVEPLMEYREDEAKRQEEHDADLEAAAPARKAALEAEERVAAAKRAAEVKAIEERDNSRRAAKAATSFAAAIAKATSLMIARAKNEAAAREAAKEPAARAASDICFDGDDLLSFD
ncbi:hypothetical protein FSPOR_11635 [Fusarium sporotrichioides]|uniref:Uncharacterized protein n=1 Tax=Fusarium sporotrichioides TaxID=5514 RepID=A0A395RG62_FUSSP|nr:hypothetical protein FSPOR_11635 [Fusarium sporotrichioides]